MSNPENSASGSKSSLATDVEPQYDGDRSSASLVANSLVDLWMRTGSRNPRYQHSDPGPSSRPLYEDSLSGPDVDLPRAESSLGSDGPADSSDESVAFSGLRPRTRRSIMRELRNYGSIAAALTRHIDALHSELASDEEGPMLLDDEGDISHLPRRASQVPQVPKSRAEGEGRRKHRRRRHYDASAHVPDPLRLPHHQHRNPFLESRLPPQPEVRTSYSKEAEWASREAGAKQDCTESEAYRVLEDVVNMGRPRGRVPRSREYEDVRAYTKERFPAEPPWYSKEGEGAGDEPGDGNGDPAGSAAAVITPETMIRVIFFRYRKGKVVKSSQPPIDLSTAWDNEMLGRNVRLHYESSKAWFFRPFTKIRFLYYIKVSYERDPYYDFKVINASYMEPLVFEGNRTISRFTHLLRLSTKHDQSLTWRLNTLRSTLKNTISVPYIYVEMVEGLSTRAILSVGLTALVFSLVCGVAYAIPTQAWGDAFTLSSLLVACFALLLAVVAIYQYLGFEKLIDDEITARSGDYTYHPGHFGMGEINA